MCFEIIVTEQRLCNVCVCACVALLFILFRSGKNIQRNNVVEIKHK